MAFLYIYLFILGLILGSFYNVVGLRIPKKQSIVKPRSACPNCHHTLTWKELIPVFSYMIQGGKCKNCRQKISLIYPLMELSCGILFVLSFHVIGLQAELIVALTLVSLLQIITVSDLAYMIIPNKVLLLFLFIIVMERTFIPLTPWYDPILGAITGFVLLYVIAIVSKGGMGGGDIKLFAVLGFFLGLSNLLLAFFLATFVGTVIGVFGMIAGQVKRKKPMPFGPSIAIGSLIAYFYGTDLVDWYLALLQ